MDGGHVAIRLVYQLLFQPLLLGTLLKCHIITTENRLFFLLVV